MSEVIKKLVITRLNNALLYCLFQNDEAVRADVFYEDEEYVLNNIYVGHIRDIVKNINSAFVEYKKDLLGYLALNENQNMVFLNNKNTDKACEGDRIIIQLIKDRIKTKDAVLTTNFSLTGEGLVLTHGKKGISISSKITDISFKKEIKEKLLNDFPDFLEFPYGIIIRTNAKNMEYSSIYEELLSLQKEYNELISIAKTREKHYLLKKSETPIISLIKELDLKEEDIIITDKSEVYNEILEKIPGAKIKFYEDKLLPLYKLYSLEKIFNEIRSKKIWLKSGAYIIIEYTEAMTVIDVNTGKCEKGKDSEKTFFNINVEAAKEIARQISLRNISGIIMIDFIDMKNNENRPILIESMKEFTKNDYIKTNIIDFTKLHLMEITRKKTRDRVFVRDGIFNI